MNRHSEYFVKVDSSEICSNFLSKSCNKCIKNNETTRKEEERNKIEDESSGRIILYHDKG